MLPPKIDKNFVCISSDKNIDLARGISNTLNCDGIYFAVFRFPEVSKPQKHDFESDDDNYLTYLIGNEASVLVLNAIAKIRPDKIIFAGLDDDQKTYFKDCPKNRAIYIDTVEDMYKLENIKEISDTSKSKREHLVIVEDNNDLSTVIAENFSKAINADLVYVKGTDRRILDSIYKYLHEWKSDRAKYASYIKIENLVKDRINEIDFTKYKSATFFTHGIPYGLVTDNPIPFCYVHKGLRDDLFIVNNIIYSNKRFGVGVVFSIDEFLQDEPLKLFKTLKENEIYPIGLFKDKANSFNFDHYASYIPYDLLHISSHGGRNIDAYQVTEKFKDRMGVWHLVEYYETVSFSSLPLDTSKNKVAVMRKTIFRKFDNFLWGSEDLKRMNLPDHVFQDMRKFMFDGKLGKKAKRVLVDGSIINSYVVLCNDGTHQGTFKILADHHSPVIFNNSCWSWGQISTFFLTGGARSYIGTLWGINVTLAKDCAIEFYNYIFNTKKTIAESLWEINKKIITNEQKNIFCAWCLPFSTIQSCNIESDFPEFIKETSFSLDRWIEKFTKTKSHELKKNTEEIIRFIIWVIHKEFEVNIIEDSNDMILEKYGYDLKQNSDVLTRDSLNS